jgi:hypothetical protein
MACGDQRNQRVRPPSGVFDQKVPGLSEPPAQAVENRGKPTPTKGLGRGGLALTTEQIGSENGAHRRNIPEKCGESVGNPTLLERRLVELVDEYDRLPMTSPQRGPLALSIRAIEDAIGWEG